MQPSDTSPAPDGGRVALPEAITAALKGLHIAAYQSGMCDGTSGDAPDSAAAFRHAERVIAQALAGPAAGAGAVPRWRHVKRGKVYEEVGRAELQVSKLPVLETDMLVIYRGADGRLFAREQAEFEDGRFERLAAVPPQAAPAAAEPASGGAADLAEVDVLRAALERIKKWFGEFPKTDRYWNDREGKTSDNEMSYAACYGSNGERDYMRQVATEALAVGGAIRRRPEPSEDAAGLIGQLVQASKNMDFWLNRNECTQLMREAVVRDFDTARAALSGHIAAQAARIAELDAELSALRTSAGAGVVVSADDAERAARDAEIEVEAERVYNSWAALSGWVAWVPRGNSHKQAEARDCARRRLAIVARIEAQDRAVIRRPCGVCMTPAECSTTGCAAVKAQDRAAGAERGEAE